MLLSWDFSTYQFALFGPVDHLQPEHRQNKEAIGTWSKNGVVLALFSRKKV
jgi:hypothetical protein